MSNLTIGVSHVGVSVADIEKTAQFLEAIGFDRVGGVESYPSIFLSDGSTLITVWRLKTETPTPFNRTKNSGLHHLALKVPSLEALDNVYDIVKGIEGVKIEFSPKVMDGAPNLSHMMCYEPNGIRVEFTYHSA